MGKYFGTDGFRGEANKKLTVMHAFQVGRFLGWYYGKKHPGERCSIVIGKDTRRSSYMFEDALSAGITSSGADVYLMHVTTTPSVAYITRVDDFDCGIMISASHNPSYDNGIKLINGNGEKLDEETTEKIEAYLDGTIGEIPEAQRAAAAQLLKFKAELTSIMNSVDAAQNRNMTENPDGSKPVKRLKKSDILKSYYEDINSRRLSHMEYADTMGRLTRRLF